MASRRSRGRAVWLGLGKPVLGGRSRASKERVWREMGISPLGVNAPAVLSILAQLSDVGLGRRSSTPLAQFAPAPVAVLSRPARVGRSTESWENLTAHNWAGYVRRVHTAYYLPFVLVRHRTTIKKSVSLLYQITVCIIKYSYLTYTDIYYSILHTN